MTKLDKFLTLTAIALLLAGGVIGILTASDLLSPDAVYTAIRCLLAFMAIDLYFCIADRLHTTK